MYFKKGGKFITAWLSVEELLDQFWIYSATSRGVSVEDEKNEDEDDDPSPNTGSHYSSPNGVIYVE